MNNTEKPLEWGDLNLGDRVLVKPPYSRFDFNEEKQYEGEITYLSKDLSWALFEVEDDIGRKCYCLSHNCSLFLLEGCEADWILVGRAS